MAETLEKMMEKFWEKWKPNTKWMTSDPNALGPEFMQDLHALCDKAVREHEIVGCIIHDPKTYFRCSKCGAGPFVVRGSTILYQGND